VFCEFKLLRKGHATTTPPTVTELAVNSFKKLRRLFCEESRGGVGVDGVSVI